MAKQAVIKFNTPIGTAAFPYLTKPDTKFNDEGDYKCDVVVAREEANELIAYLTHIRDKYNENIVPGKRKVILSPVAKKELDDAGDETGNFIFRTKLKAGGTRKDGSKWSQSPQLFDADGQTLGAGVDVWSGSRVAVAGVVKAYDMTIPTMDAEGNSIQAVRVGLSLQCKAVQVVELVSASGGSASSFGFGKVEGGYVAPAVEAGIVANDPVSDEDDGDEDF